uniref:Uncharacterized protein n=1 Tax=Strigamia maritima TaxID=126957 RepID=T1JBP8_STRMM
MGRDKYTTLGNLNSPNHMLANRISWIFDLYVSFDYAFWLTDFSSAIRKQDRKQRTKEKARWLIGLPAAFVRSMEMLVAWHWPLCPSLFTSPPGVQYGGSQPPDR